GRGGQVDGPRAMYRRRRRTAREIGFSFDSFLDVVANVVGIIIRLILVVWVGARSYSSVQALLHQPLPTAARSAAEEPHDPLQDELARQRRELAEAQAHLLEQLQHFHQVDEKETAAAAELAGLAARRQEADLQRQASAREAAAQTQTHQGAVLSLEEVRERCRRLAEEARTPEQAAQPRRALRYRTPVSRPVQSEELFFECRGGRVTFIDLAPMLTEVRRGMDDIGKQLRTLPQVTGTAGPAGAFRLRYTVDRER